VHPLGSVRLQTFSYSSYPDKSKERARLHKDVDAILLEDQAFQTLHARFRTKSDLGIDLLDAAIWHKVPFSTDRNFKCYFTAALPGAQAGATGRCRER
jgi:hypothetical protein